MTNYPVGDFLIQIKNAALTNKRSLTVTSTNLIKDVAEALKRIKILEAVENKNHKITITLAFHKKEPRLVDLKLISKPGLRVYINRNELEEKVGVSTYILSTSQGVLSQKEAVKKGVGGEIIAEIF